MADKTAPVAFSPALRADDPLANYWMRQVTLRLRREICWLRHLRGLAPNADPEALPPFSDRTSEALDLTRFREEKDRFFRTDITADYLSGELERAVPRPEHPPQRGSFSWVGERLQFDDVSLFVLAMGLIAAFDSATGDVIAACLNDPIKTRPTLSLAQKLWDEPEKVLPLADPEHRLFRSGLLQFNHQMASYAEDINWDLPLSVPSLIVHQLLFPESALPGALQLAATAGNIESTFPENMDFVASRINAASENTLKVVPVLGARNAQHVDYASAISRKTGKELAVFSGNPAFLGSIGYRNALAALCWLRGLDLFLDEEVVAVQAGRKPTDDSAVLPSHSIPITIFPALTTRDQLKHFPEKVLLPVVELPVFSYLERVAFWRSTLGRKAKGKEAVIKECARRFRYEKTTIGVICRGLVGLKGPISGEDFIAACRSELDIELGGLAQKVTPRFQDEEVILPPKQARQLREIYRAMTALTEVHYGWGTAQVWNESGLSVLFAGPPGTGKTMAAEVLGFQLDLPIYRIDLSEVVNKYIGETEKNLKRLFDAADQTDLILFFDEADSLFGRRTEVKDAHDRYANLEISYLLERMERFKGLAILATNRKKDLDEAFLRRLRYVVDFPMPEAEQRRKIWRQVIPPAVDASDLNFDFLAKKFPLAGGHIRSIVFNACLQSANRAKPAGENAKYRLKMEAVIRAVKREYEKLNRSIGLEQFGPYADVIRNMEKDEQDQDR